MSLTKFTITCIFLQICFVKMVISDLLITRLIHHDSVHSPFYDSKMTIEDRVKKDLEITRAFYLNESSSFLPTTIRTEVRSKRHGFTAYLEVGAYEVGQYLYMDTGSNLLWVNCEPCGLNVPGPIFHPAESYSYKAENCRSSKFCGGSIGAVKTSCGIEDRCDYEQRYIGGITNSGHLAVEMFLFGNKTKSVLNNIVFGCSAKTNLYANGVFGLGPHPVSLVSQVSSTKFSYRVGNISDEFYAFNTLFIGNELNLSYVQTPMIIEDKYYVNLEFILLEDTKLEIDPQIFRRNSDAYTGGMLIDSATTISFIPQVALDKLQEEIAEWSAALDLVQNYSFIWNEGTYPYTRLCYNGILSRDWVRFPLVTFRFIDNANMDLLGYHYFPTS